MDVRHPRVVLLEEFHRRAEVSGHIVADVEVGPVVLRVAERGLEILRRLLGVGVVADHQAVLVRELSDAFRTLDFELARDGLRAHRFCQRERIVHFRIGELVDPVVLHDLDAHARVIPLLPQHRGLRRVRRQTPRAQRFRAGLRILTPPPGRRRAHRELDGLRAQLDGADAQRQRSRQSFIDREIAAPVVIREVEPDLHARPLRVGLGLKSPENVPRQQAGQGQRQHQFSKVASGIFHRSS